MTAHFPEISFAFFLFFWKTIKDFIQWRLKIEFEYKKSKENFNTQMKFNSINFSQFFQKLYKKYLTCFSINLCTLFWFFLQSYMCEALEPKINTKEKFKGAQKKRKREEEENLCSGQAYTHFDILLDWMIFSSLLQQNSRYIEKARNKKKENAIFTWLKSVEYNKDFLLLLSCGVVFIARN